MTEEETFFVQIANPAGLRKNILLSSKQIIVSLKRYEELNELRKQKVDILTKLRNKNKEIRMLASQLVNFLPKTTIKPAVITAKQEKKEVMRDIRKTSKEANTELEKLENELEGIERKIERLY